MMQLGGKRLLVVGLGLSGAASARVAAGLGASVDLVDRSEKPLRGELAEELRAAGVKISLGVEAPPSLERYDLVVASPGVPDRAPVLAAARAAGLRVISELELGYRLLEADRMVAVTGTNGKTTTTRLIGNMLEAGGVPAVTCGNIGNPLVGLYGRLEPGQVPVVEVSSFQLQNIEDFSAEVSVALNIAPDHFDWHADFDEYREAKMRLVENSRAGDLLVYNADDIWCREMSSRTRGRAWGFSLGRAPGAAAWTEEGWIVTGPPLEEARLMPVAELKLAGIHNVQNVMAGALAALECGVGRGTVREAAAAFSGLEHRMEYAGTVEGVRFYNDSKATNPHAALHALISFEGPAVAIMGGRNKGLDFSEVARELCARLSDGRVRGVVLVGESAMEMLRAVEGLCGPSARGRVLTAPSLDESVARAHGLSGGEGVIIFTPACASFDMFADYKERGRAFKESVRRFELERSGGGAPGGGQDARG